MSTEGTPPAGPPPDSPSAYSTRHFVAASVVLFALVGLGLFGVAELFTRAKIQKYITPRILKEESMPFMPGVYARTYMEAKARKISLAGLPGVHATVPYAQINSRGFRGPEVPVEKPAGVRRVLVIGGSAAFDIYQDLGTDWPRQLEGLLAEAGHEKVQVLNFGLSGATAMDSLGRLLAEAHLYGPDVVLLYNTWNDLKTFSAKPSLLRSVEPYVPGRNPFLNYYNAFDEFLSEYSQLYVRVRQNALRKLYPRGVEGLRTAADGLSDQVDPAGLRQFHLTARAFADVARSCGAVPVLVRQARLPHPDNTAKELAKISHEWTGLTHAGLRDAWAKVDAELEAVAAEAGCPLIDADTPMSGKPEFFLDHIHTSSAGSKRLAEVVAAGLDPILRGIPAN